MSWGTGGGCTGRGSIYRDGQRVPVLGGLEPCTVGLWGGESLYGQVQCIMGMGNGHMGPLFLLPE